MRRLFVLLGLALTACRQDAADQSTIAAPTASAVAAPVIPAAPPSAFVGDDETLHFTGTEPFWGGEVSGTSLTYTTPENQAGIAIEVTRSIAAGSLALSGTFDGKPFALGITEGRCSDGMSDRSYPFTAVLRVDGEVRHGCGWGDEHPFGELGKR